MFNGKELQKDEKEIFTRLKLRCYIPFPFLVLQTEKKRIQVIQPTRCNSFTSLLLDVYVWLKMFRVSPRPSSGAYDCTRSLWFYRWREAAGAFLVVVW